MREKKTSGQTTGRTEGAATEGVDEQRLSTLYNRGEHARVLELVKLATIISPCDAALLNLAGASARVQGDYRMAEFYWRRAAELKPDFAEVHYNLGILLKELKRPDESEAAYREALLFRPGFADAFYNLGILLKDQKRFAEAEQAYNMALQYRPGYAEVYNNLGILYREQCRFEESEAAYREALRHGSSVAAIFNNLGNLLKDLKRFGDAAEAFEKALRLKSDYGHALAQLLDCNRQLCDWYHVAKNESAVLKSIARGVKDLVPLGILSIGVSDRMMQRQAGEVYALHTLAPRLELPPLVGPNFHPNHDRLRIGYLSGDFHSHATMHLIGGVLEGHNRKRFAIYAYSYGPEIMDLERRRVQEAIEVFRDLRILTDEEAAAQIVEDGIDILVDLKGFTAGSRLEISSLRPAPVIVNWLGYPGTLGHPRLADYIIGDAIVTPPAHAEYFSETLALMPYSYQPNDRKRKIGKCPSRGEVGLPAKGIVFCCFNQNYKFNEKSFDVWCRLLREVPGSVLWLLEPTAPAIANLKREALMRSVGEERLIFAPYMGQEEHLGRLQLADLALDTFPYGSHTTGSDALWAGVPLVTLIGETFASRVAASLLHAVGLPELVTTGWEEYFELAKGLAFDPAVLAALKGKLARQRLTSPLFDTVRFTRDLEALYEKIWEQHGQGFRAPILPMDHRGKAIGIAHSTPFFELLCPNRLTAVVDIGANRIDGDPPYKSMLEYGMCEVTGFEPQQSAFEELQANHGPLEKYLPYAVGDGQMSTLKICKGSGMTSLFEPDLRILTFFDALKPLSEVVERIPIKTRRLDEIDEIDHIDFLKIDIQGGELNVLRNGSDKLISAVVIQVEVSFVTLYEGQPCIGDVDLELRHQGFIPHCFAAVKKWPISPCVINGNPRQPLNQLLEADMVYVRDFNRLERLSSEQLKQLALIAHYCYASFDLALRSVGILEKRGALAVGAQERYLSIVRRKG